MKKTFSVIIGISIFLLNINQPAAKDNKYNYEVEFGSSKEDRILQFNGNGNVNIVGYNGKKILLSSDENVFEDDEANEKAKGLRKIGGGGFNIINSKEENVIIVARPVHKEIDLDVKVPNNITLKFGTGVVKPSNFHLSKVLTIGPDFEKKAKEFEKHTKEFEKHTKELEKQAEELEKKSEKLRTQTIIIAPEAEEYVREAQKFIGGAVKMIMPAPSNGIIEGDITINDFKGLVEASTIQGNITVNNMDGMVLANTVEGDINVTFRKLSDDKELYISTVNGDIDITLPKNANADVMAKTIEGDVYSGFDGAVIYGKKLDSEKSAADSQSLYGNMFRSDYITTRINKGGQEVYLNTINGSIYIRKGD
jgi:exonuclease VII small subunit